MQLYTLPEDTTLYALARRVGRNPRHLAAVNGIPRTAKPARGTKIIIPAPPGCQCKGATPCLLCCSVEGGRQGDTPFLHGSGISLILHHTGAISYKNPGLSLPRRRHRTWEVPTLLAPVCDGICPSDVGLAEEIKTHGYSGLALPYFSPPEWYEPLICRLHEADMLFALLVDGNTLLSCPDIANIACDIFFIKPPEGISLECFLSDLSLTLCPRVRKRILLSYQAGDALSRREKGARKGRRGRQFCCGRDLEDCYLGLCRLLHDGYGGILTPCGRTSPQLYHMITELTDIIPSSQRTGRRSRS